MQTQKPLREYDAATSRKSTWEIQHDIYMMRNCKPTPNRRRTSRLDDVAYRVTTAIIVAGCATCIGLLLHAIFTNG